MKYIGLGYANPGSNPCSPTALPSASVYAPYWYRVSGTLSQARFLSVSGCEDVGGRWRTFRLWRRGAHWCCCLSPVRHVLAVACPCRDSLAQRTSFPPTPPTISMQKTSTSTSVCRTYEEVGPRKQSQPTLLCFQYCSLLPCYVNHRHVWQMGTPLCTGATEQTCSTGILTESMANRCVHAGTRRKYATHVRALTCGLARQPFQSPICSTTPLPCVTSSPRPSPEPKPRPPAPSLSGQAVRPVIMYGRTAKHART